MSQNNSQDLDAILKLWAESFLQTTPETLPEGCQHDGKYYIGFREEYEFCTKCDAKKLNGVWCEAPTKH